MKKERKIIGLRHIKPNTGQLEWLPKNPRRWDDSDEERTRKSIVEDGDFLEDRPLLVVPMNDEYVVFAGNLRREGSIKAKLTEVPCVVYYPENEDDYETVKRRALKDNGSFGSWDFDLLASDWDNLPLADWGVPLMTTDPEAEDNEMEKVSEDDFDEDEDVIEPKTKPGEIFMLGDHRLMCGDSTDVQTVRKLMEEGTLKADLVLTDPPYNVAVKNSQGMTIANDDMGTEDFGQFLRSAFAAINSVMGIGCPFYVWFASKEHINFERALNDNGLQVRQELVWNKNHFILGRAHYQWKHEPCLYGWKGEVCRYFAQWRNRASVIEDEAELDIDKMKKKEMADLLRKIYSQQIPTTVIDEAKPLKDEDHPTMKPVRLIGYLMSNSSKVGDIVLDTFGGSGTTLIAAEQLGRKCYMMELDPHYCDVIIARWEKMTGKAARKL